MNNEELDDLFTSDEVDHIVKKVRNHQANLGIFIAALVVLGLYIYHHL